MAQEDEDPKTAAETAIAPLIKAKTPAEIAAAHHAYAVAALEEEIAVHARTPGNRLTRQALERLHRLDPERADELALDVLGCPVFGGH